MLRNGYTVKPRLRYINVLFLICTLIFHSQNFSRSLKFNHLTMKDGLSNNVVYSILQDKRGFIWFATNDGLNRYDGYNLKVFRNNPGHTNSISDNSVWSIFEDSKGYIWIGTKKGTIDKYDPLTSKFISWKLESELTGEISVKSICEDTEGNIWIGTYKSGLYKLDQTTGKIKNWEADPASEKSLSSNYNLSVINDINGNIIIGTYNGLNILNPGKEEQGFRKIYFDHNSENSLSDNIIWALSKSSIDSSLIYIGTSNHISAYNSITSAIERIYIKNPANLQYGTSSGFVVDEIKNGDRILWASTYSGIIRINLNNRSTTRFLHNHFDQQSLGNDQVNCIIKDDTGVLWAATENGISFNTKKSAKFNSHNYIFNDDYLLSNINKKSITAISSHSDGNIWIGTKEGLYLITDINGSPNIKNFKKFDSDYIWSLFTTNKNDVWVGTYGRGLYQFNSKKNSYTKWNLTKDRFQTQAPYYIKSIIEDSKKNIWVGYWGAGLTRINPQTGVYNLWVNDAENSKSISHDDVWSIIEDRLGRIWIGTQGGGLNLYIEKNGGEFLRWMQHDTVMNPLGSENIYCFYEDIQSQINSLNSILWIGSSNGLIKFEVLGKSDTNVFDFETNILVYTVADGLPDNSVNSITGDNKGNLWLGTSSGISSFDIKNEKFTNFSTADGINGTSMNPASILKLKNGNIIIGSTEGINIFNPEEIELSSYEPELLFTDFQIFNTSIKPGSNSPLSVNITSAKIIELSYLHDVFSFQFAALDYNSSKSIKYAYLMEGFDKDWINSDRRRFVTYTNLDPGEYTFKVKSTNADMVWNSLPTTITVKIAPPFWATWWAYLIYILLFVFAIYVLRIYDENKRAKKERERMRKAEEKAKLEKSELRAETAEYKAKVLESEKEIEKQQIRNRISTDLHDEIGSNLSSIVLLSSLAKKKEIFDIELKKYIGEINNAAKISAEAIRDIIWLINPVSDPIEKLTAKMTETANYMLGNIEREIITNNISHEEKLRPDVKRNIFLIYKEVLNNIIKHSKADHVKIKIEENNNMLFLSITDNGIGFNMEKSFNGNGLRNLKYRSEQINGKLDIITKNGEGTRVIFNYNMA